MLREGRAGVDPWRDQLHPRAAACLEGLDSVKFTVLARSGHKMQIKQDEDTYWSSRPDSLPRTMRS